MLPAPIRVWPVIHLSTIEQAVTNAKMAQRCGAHGVFLIHMGGLDDLIEPAFHAVKQACPFLGLGANYLSLPASLALEQSLQIGFDATWSDNPGVRSDNVTEVANLLGTRLAQEVNHTFFGSIAFKYQPFDPDPGLAAFRAINLGMLPTTSGVATGSAPDIDKLVNIRDKIGPISPLALASGVTPDNVKELSPYLSDILISTGISSDFHTFNEKLLAKLMSQIGL